MAQITLRGMDPEMEQAIRKTARKSGKSLNRVILDMIRENASYRKSRKISQADSLRTLAGGWSEKDASDFLESIKSSEQIDEEMWR
jgi:hypothetical protein